MKDIYDPIDVVFPEWKFISAQHLLIFRQNLFIIDWSNRSVNNFSYDCRGFDCPEIENNAETITLVSMTAYILVSIADFSDY